MNKQTIALLRTSFAEVARRRPDVAAVFYKRLFEVAPDLRPMFSPSLKEQQKRLKASMTQLVASLAETGELPAQLAWLGEHRADVELRSAHHKIVGDTLLWTFQHALQQNFTKPIRAAWAEAYNVIAKKMIAADARDKPSKRMPAAKRTAAMPDALASVEGRSPVTRRAKRTASATAAESDDARKLVVRRVKQAASVTAAESDDTRRSVVRRVKRTASVTAAESGKRKAARRPVRKPARRTTRAK